MRKSNIVLWASSKNIYFNFVYRRSREHPIQYTTGKERRFHKQKKKFFSDLLASLSAIRERCDLLVFESMSFCNNKESWKKQRNVQDSCLWEDGPVLLEHSQSE